MIKYLFNTRALGLVFIVCVFACLTACGGGDKNNNTKSANNTTDTSSSTAPTKDVNKNNNHTSQEEGKQKPTTPTKLSTNVEDYYKIWLKDFYADLEYPPKFKMLEKDITNGYMKFMTKGDMGFYTMTLWAAKNGKTTLGVLSYGCGPMCAPDNIIFYELANGALKDVTEKVLPVKIQERLQKLAYEKRGLDKKYSNFDDGYWIELPKHGTTVKMGLRLQNQSNKRAFEELMAELQYNVEDNTFKLVEK